MLVSAPIASHCFLAINPIYSVLWNQALGRFCITSELGCSRATTRCNAGPTSPVCLPALALCVALAWAMPAWSQPVLPQGPDVVSGSAQVTTAGNRMTVQQGTDKAILNWQSFHIGAGKQVNFQQPNAASVALNRVVGSDASAIHGALNANGKVFLVNPNGVLFGQGANIDVGGLVASTLDISNENFLKGNYQFNGPGTHLQGGTVTHQGTITATEHGAVALLGGTVSNQGTIAARLGSVALAAGNQVTLDFAGDGLLSVQVDEPALKALAENHHFVQADGGSVLITAKATDALLQTVVNNTGTVQARTVENHEGKIVLRGGFHGTARVAGVLDASAPDGGNGGFIDTGAGNVQIADTTHVTAQADQGKAGTWLLDSTHFTIGTGEPPQSRSRMAAQTLNASLTRADVILRTSDAYAGNGPGTIQVDDPVTWSQNKLTLNAYGSIKVTDVMAVDGTGTLALNYGNAEGVSLSKPTAGSSLRVSGRVDFAQAGNGLLSIHGEDHVVIKDLISLQNIQRTLAGKFALGASIDATATANDGYDSLGFAPIGNVSAPFTGTFDGLGHTIHGLTIRRPQTPFVGLFGYASNATLRNVGLVGGCVTGKCHVGGLVGYQVARNGGTATIFNVHTDLEVHGNNLVGGLVGQNVVERSGLASIDSSHASGYVGADLFLRPDDFDSGKGAGGLAGSNGVLCGGVARISNSHSTGNVVGTRNVGGVVGMQSINNAVETESITAHLCDVSATGQVSGKRWTGKLIGACMIYQKGPYFGSMDAYDPESVPGSVRQSMRGSIGTGSASAAGAASQWGRTTTPVHGVIGASAAAAGGGEPPAHPARPSTGGLLDANLASCASAASYRIRVITPVHDTMGASAAAASGGQPPRQAKDSSMSSRGEAQRRKGR